MLLLPYPWWKKFVQVLLYLNIELQARSVQSRHVKVFTWWFCIFEYLNFKNESNIILTYSIPKSIEIEIVSKYLYAYNILILWHILLHIWPVYTSDANSVVLALRIRLKYCEYVMVTTAIQCSYGKTIAVYICTTTEGPRMCSVWAQSVLWELWYSVRFMLSMRNVWKEITAISLWKRRHW